MRPAASLRAETAERRPSRSDAFRHPAVLAAVVLLALNDQVLKARCPSWLTGKLSDVAGLAFFPLLLAALVAPVAPRCGHRRLVAGCLLATGLVFAAVKCVPAATDVYRVGLGLLQWPLRALVSLAHGAPVLPPAPVFAVTDPSDLLALPAMSLSWWVARRSERMPADRPARG